MTNLPGIYPPSGTSRSPAMLPFDRQQIDQLGIRVLPAEFSRLMGCSKQAVSIWIKSGKINLGADGRVDPRQAVAQLLRNSDPARIRSKVLEPLVRDITVQQRRIAQLENDLVEARENAAFHEEAASQFLGLIDAMRDRLAVERAFLGEMPGDRVISGLFAWLDIALANGGTDESILALAAGEERGGK